MATPFFWGPWLFVVDNGAYLAVGGTKTFSWTGSWIADHVVTPVVVPLHKQGTSQKSTIEVLKSYVTNTESGPTYYVQVKNDGPDPTNFYVYIGGVAP